VTLVGYAITSLVTLNSVGGVQDLGDDDSDEETLLCTADAYNISVTIQN
jgi:hypothetical protein